MGIIIPQPTFVDPNNPTDDETAADTLYKARAQVVLNIVSPDLAARLTLEQIPASIVFEEGSLRVDEAQVMKDADMTTAEVQALTSGSAELEALVYATEVRRAIRILPQAAQIVGQRSFSTDTQLQEIDWELREERLVSDYQGAIRVVNADAVFVDTEGFGTPLVVTTSSSMEYAE